MWRNGLFTAGRPQRGHAVFTTLQFQLNKVMLHFQPILTTAFFKMTPDTLAPPTSPPTTVTPILELERHFKKGMRGREG